MDWMFFRITSAMNTPAETRDIANLAIRLCDGKAGDLYNAAILSAVACDIYDEWKRKNFEDVAVSSKCLAEFGAYMVKRYRDIQSHRQSVTHEFNHFLVAYKAAQRMTHLTTQES
jgi:hypothetical protein